ncbi:hypothetical protein D3C80_2132340 [compost metagenome]
MPVGFGRELGIDFLVQQPCAFLKGVDIVIDGLEAAHQPRGDILETVRHLVLIGGRRPPH